jgi:site-specific recombinase XerD
VLHGFYSFAVDSDLGPPLLGHLDLDTTRGYTAVFPEQVIEAHRKMVEHRPGPARHR